MVVIQLDPQNDGKISEIVLLPHRKEKDCGYYIVEKV
jgi:hypothetical protein